MPGEPGLASEMLATSGSWGLFETVPEGFPQHGRSFGVSAGDHGHMSDMVGGSHGA